MAFDDGYSIVSHDQLVMDRRAIDFEVKFDRNWARCRCRFVVVAAGIAGAGSCCACFAVADGSADADGRFVVVAAVVAVCQHHSPHQFQTLE